MMPAGALDVLLGAAARASLVLTGALVAAAAMRRQSASLRHWILSSAIVIAALAPALARAVPSWRLPAAISMPVAAVASSPAGGVFPASATNVASLSPQGAAPGARSLAATLVAILPAIWFVGVVANASILVAGLSRLAWIVSHARPLA